MAPLRLLAAMLAAHLQLSFGQQINEGTNLIAVASHKLAAIKQQSQKQNITDTEQASDSEDKLDHNLDPKTENDLEAVSINTSTLYPVGGTITSIKFVKNPAYDGLTPSFSIINNKDTTDPISTTYDTTLFNLIKASPNDAPLNSDAQEANQQTEDTIGFVGQSPLFISFMPRCSGVMSSQSPYITSALPTQSSLPNKATVHSPPALPLNQQSLKTVSSAQFQPSNVQSPANMRLRFIPAPTTVPMQCSGPAQSALSIQSTVPIQSPVPLQSAVPIQTKVQTQNTMQSTKTIQNTVPIQGSVPIQNTIPMQNTAPIHSTIQRTVPIQNPIGNIIQNPNLSLLLAHLLSQNSIKQDPAPTSIRYASQDQQQPPKQNTVNTLLPLLLQLLTEKNNNCCEYKNKRDRSRTCSRYKHGNKKANDKFEADFGMLPDTAHHFRRVNQNRRLNKPKDETLEEEDYSNESSDYSVEQYDDED